MTKSEDSGSPGWRASFFTQTTEDVARVVAAAAAAATSPRSSVIFSSTDDSGGQIQKFQHQVTRFLKGLTQPEEVKNVTYNPEVLTSLKRQWANNQLQYLDHRSVKEPTRLFESIVVVGLHPNCDIQMLERQFIGRTLSPNQSRVEPSLEPQVLFVYPPEKPLPLKSKDLLSFCFPGGVEVNAVERTPSMSELNEILLGQEHLKQSDLSFVFRLQVPDDSTLYGCCVLVEELVHKPSGLLSMISDKQPSYPSLSRHVLTTRRCYCILSRLPFFELHFGVLSSIFTEERLERLTKGICGLDLEAPEDYGRDEILDENSEETSDNVSVDDSASEHILNGALEFSQSKETEPGTPTDTEHQMSDKGIDSLKGKADEIILNGSPEIFQSKETEPGTPTYTEHQMSDKGIDSLKEKADEIIAPADNEIPTDSEKRDSSAENGESCDVYVDDVVINKQTVDRRLPNAVLPLLRYYQYESSESSSSFQGSPCEDRSFRSDVDDTETEDASFSGQDDSNDLLDILEWAKANGHGSLQIICEYYRLPCPTRSSTLRFHPLEHLHPLEYHRPEKKVINITGSTIDLRSCNTNLEYAETHNALLVEEEATALSIWAVASMCGSLRLENILTLFAGALLEKQIVVICSNLGILSAIVLSIIPLIRPYQWQCLLMPVLPNDMLDFLDAPVPYIVGVKNKTNEVQSKLSNAIMVDANKNQVKSPSTPQLPQQRELFSSLSPYHAKLVGESYLGKKRPMYECTDAQVEAAKGFLSVLRTYLDSLCSNLRSHTITNVQSNDDKVSLLLKESFIDSYPSRDRPFMKLFVDTQLFSVHTDLVLSFFQKE